MEKRPALHTKEIVITGAGIGGLTAALALHGAGFRVHVYEAAEEIRELGVGINIQPHAVAILARLGLLEELYKAAIPTSSLIYFNRHGQKIWAEPRGINAGNEYPQFSIHRGRLQMLLLRAATERLGKGAIHTGHCLSSFIDHGDGAEATFTNRTTSKHVATIKGDALIAAEGIHSTVRKILYPDEGLPKFTGIQMWRGIIETEPFLDGKTMIMAGNPAIQKFVAYPVCPQAASRGKALVNWVAEIQTGGNIPPPSDWNRKAEKADFAPAFAEWKFDWLDIPRLIEETAEVFQFPMVDRDPLPRWSYGQVTLLGDAAHPMYPIGSNGASQAILDADALTRALCEGTSVEEALHDYEKVRLPATAAVVESNRRMGPERVMQLVEERSPGRFADLEAVISKQELEEITMGYKVITRGR